MKNLQIGDNDLIGNKFNGHDLHIYLNNIGIESNHLIANPLMSKDKKTFQIGSDYSQNIRNIMSDVDKHYNLTAGTHTLPFDIIYNKLFLESDVVHMHLIHNGMFNVNLLPLLTSLKPVVWTLHDPWILSGHCIHHFDCNKWQTGCGDCPDLKTPFKISKDSTVLNWEMKRIAFQNSQMTLIVASKWMQDLVKKSPLLKNFDTHLIPFGINQNIFKPAPIKEAKARLGIKDESLVLMFRIQDSKFKGSDLLLEVLPKIKSKNKITLITVGEDGLLNHLKKQFDILEFDWVSEDDKLISLYQACDIFIMPSKVESFGMMAIEAMSVKKPVIVLKGTSLSEVTQAPDIGIECDRNAESLLNAIQNLIDNPEERAHRAELGYQYALKEYGSEIYVKRIVEVYKSAIKNHKPSPYRDNVVEQLIKHNPLNKNNHNIFSLQSKAPLLMTKTTKTQKIYLFGFMPIAKVIHAENSFRIKIAKSITLFKKKIVKNKIKYYILGIPVLRIK